eukprot:CAMPEP_0172835296 /NCGR_PEP_ID=MMETSP1075-20121228/25646_1 /TAXON_ID=2916 /ORGANISM="Ceratium fusus, Strain PA161109" /LENGTH=110 /DNA_ID=CAMNT_0013678319 /DNA_START=166 /DNA_END=498 /DNA_ORIENTATION=-
MSSAQANSCIASKTQQSTCDNASGPMQTSHPDGAPHEPNTDLKPRCKAAAGQSAKTSMAVSHQPMRPSLSFKQKASNVPARASSITKGTKKIKLSRRHAGRGKAAKHSLE